MLYYAQDSNFSIPQFNGVYFCVTSHFSETYHNINMTDQQKELLHLCVVEQTNYKTIAQKLNVSSLTLIKWYEELKEDRMKIAEIGEGYTTCSSIVLK